MWIIQESNIKNQIRFTRQSLFIRERQDGESKIGPDCEAEMPDQHCLQITDRGVAGVEHEVSFCSHRAHQIALAQDAVTHWSILRERMAPTRFGVAAAQNFILAIEKYETH